MTDLKLIESENKHNFIDIEKESGFVAKRPTVTPKEQTIGLSVSACRAMNVDDYTHCHISSLTELAETTRLYLRFNKGEVARNNFKLLKPKDTSVRSGATISGTTTVVRKVPRFAAIVKKPLKDRKTELRICKETGLYYIPIAPEFEVELKDLENPPKDAAIYKILFNGNILNIGETNNLARRLKEKKEKGVVMHQVFYSPMNTMSDEERRSWESWHIDNYVNLHGSLPPHNHQLGRQSD